MSESEKNYSEIVFPTDTYPLLPLRDVVIYPHMVIPLFVGRERSLNALKLAMAHNKQIFLTAQKHTQVNNPKQKDIFAVGTMATVLQMLEVPAENTVKVLVEGTYRAKLKKMLTEKDFLLVEVEALEDRIDQNIDVKILMRNLIEQFENYIKLNKKIPPEILTSLSGIDNPGHLTDTIAAHMPLQISDKQKILEKIDVQHRMELVLGLLNSEIDLLQVEQRIHGRVKQQMEKSQREYYLNEKMKAIQKELSEIDEGSPVNEVEQLKQKIKNAGMPQEAEEKALAELKKMQMMSPMSAEATVSRNYLDWLLAIPWKKHSKVNNNLIKAEKVLDADHYGLEKVKERILEYLAVQQRAKKVKGPILCLVGPPGVGKTSLGQSIANATGRKFVRMSLGGIRDEAEIRGHRRTYIGSLPGKIIQKISKVKVKNPLFMLDEVDKMAMDFRGDPASALLEVLDPEQNFAFNDHYLEVDYDLSDVMFIATANSLNIPSPLLDRMEVIRIPGYTEEEKLNIAMHYLVEKQMSQAGVTAKEIHLSENAVCDIIRYYTREAGVRNLEREIAKICRKVVKEILTKKVRECVDIHAKNLEKYLGVRKFRFGLAEKNNEIGQVTGLAWTEVGGELLKIEAAVVPGKGKSIYTGRLGDVMQESIQAAMTVVRSRSEILAVPADFYAKNDVHVHVPEGATPKDGPSAGIGMCTALVSALTHIPARADVAMTGEITLRGEVLPIGGLKEKLLAALRGGIKKVIIPAENQKDLKEIPDIITKEMKIIPVKWIDEVLALALERMPEAIKENDATMIDPISAKKKSKIKSKERRTH